MRFKLYFILILTFLITFIPIVSADSVNQEPDSTFITNPNKLVFVSKDGDKPAIYVMSDDGTGLTKLTDNDDDVSYPLWSPDATRILYISSSGSYFDRKHAIRVVNSDGTGRLQLSDNCETIFTPLSFDVSWAPDGSRIIYSAKENGKKGIFVINSDGSNELCLTENDIEGTYPSWSPDGSKILCLLKNKGDREIYLMNPDGTEPIRLTKNSGGYKKPTWSPDGKKIAFVYDKPFFAIFGRKSGIYVMNADGSDLTWLAKGDNIFWAPDSSAIAFTYRKSYSSGGHTSYNNATGNSTYHGGTTTTTYSTYLINIAKKSRAQYLGNCGSDTYPGWSHDATKIAYISYFSLYIRISGQGEPVNIDIPFATGTPIWSPDGTKIACIGRSNLFSKPNIFIANIDGDEVYKMTGDESFSEPAWAPVK